MSSWSSQNHFLLDVYTGDRDGAGTDSSVQVTLSGEEGETSNPILLDRPFSNDFERGEINQFTVSRSDYGSLKPGTKVSSIEIRKNDSGLFPDWFVDKIIVQCPSQGTNYIFPVYRWIKPGQPLRVSELDTSLPYEDKNQLQRSEELQEKRKQYVLSQLKPGIWMAKFLPNDEKFSFNYKFDVVTNVLDPKINSFLKQNLNIFDDNPKRFTSLEELEKLNGSLDLSPPEFTRTWRQDVHFGRQRVAGVTPSLIKLVERIPEKFPVTDELLQPHIEGLTLREAIEKKRLFLCDLESLQGVVTMDHRVLCAPMCLLFLGHDKQLRPVAIQLFQKPIENNPIFTPADDNSLWTLVKMWYNNADASYHQAGAHIANTHHRMEGVCLVTHRNISPSHPLFKLLMPHFLYLMAINNLAVQTLVNPGGYVDKTFGYGCEGLLEVSAKFLSRWRMDVEGSLPADLESRGVADPTVLPYYPYRDDALLVYNAIHTYVNSYVELYYKDNTMLDNDHEVQAWVRDLVKEPGGSDRAGLGLKGVPGNGRLTTTQQLTKILTSVIFTCSVTHAAVNFPQYSQYSFPPNYPGTLNGTPPQGKHVNVSEQDILEALPDYSYAMNLLVITNTLSWRGTESLGHFPVQYIHDPAALEVVEEFRKRLNRISGTIEYRNQQRSEPYDYLDPLKIPNSISI